MSALGQKRTSRTIAIYVRFWGQSGHWMSAFGHTDLSMLQKHYAAFVGDAEAEAAERIEDVLGQLTKPTQNDNRLQEYLCR